MIMLANTKKDPAIIAQANTFTNIPWAEQYE